MAEIEAAVQRNLINQMKNSSESSVKVPIFWSPAMIPDTW